MRKIGLFDLYLHFENFLVVRNFVLRFQDFIYHYILFHWPKKGRGGQIWKDKTGPGDGRLSC
jgi:hypothetical protein